MSSSINAVTAALDDAKKAVEELKRHIDLHAGTGITMDLAEVNTLVRLAKDVRYLFIARCYYQGMRQTEIAKLMNVTPSRVCQIVREIRISS